MSKNLLNDYIEGMKEHLESNKLIRINSIDELDITRGELFEALDNEKIEYWKPFEMYTENGQIKTVPDDCIYCNQFYINEEVE